ncbi:unnamed protein product [Allacma fusca]|uniref:Uncharacterized protein n=1 Tax=Allacma fusca TaxID=39272 RepID=A0A8J2LBZ1_9HEXA|nr:unnamed protein product [Allacma fusca]
MNVSRGEIFFRVFLIFSTFAGLFPVKNPFRKIQEIQYGAINAFTLASAVIFIYCAIVITDFSTNDMFLSDETVLSKKIIFYTGITSSYVNTFIIRITAFVYCQRTLELIKILDWIFQKLKFSNGFDLKRKSQTVPWIVISLTLGLTIFVICSAYATFELASMPQEVLYKLKSLSGIDILARVLITFEDQISSLPMFFAVVFVLVVGCVLVEAHTSLSDILVSALETQSMDGLQGAGGLFRKHVLLLAIRNENQCPPKNFECRFKCDIRRDFPQLIQLVRKCFEIYSTVGGWYIFGLLFVAVMDIVNAFSDFTFMDFDKLRNLCWMVLGIYHIIMLALFGEFMEHQVIILVMSTQDLVIP